MSRHLGKAAGLAGGAFALAAALAIALIGAAPAAAGPETASLRGRTFDQRIRAAGYPSPGGENIAKGYVSASAVMTGWMNSPGHRANILNCSFTALGVGYDTRGNYWVQNFGY
jgi:hypothetical protein